MAFGILEFWENVHFGIMGFGLFVSGKVYLGNWDSGNRPTRFLFN
jgi:hypothetical protein